MIDNAPKIANILNKRIGRSMRIKRTAIIATANIVLLWALRTRAKDRIKYINAELSPLDSLNKKIIIGIK